MKNQTARLGGFIAGLALLCAGCAGGNLGGSDARAGLACVDDSPGCIAKRQAALRHLNARHDRSWLREPAGAKAYASGVRLFAMRQQKKLMSCSELKLGRQEAARAASVMRGPGGGSLTPAQVSRGKMLASEVARELARESQRRCKGKG